MMEWFDYQLLFSPPPTNLPKEERMGYFEEWTAGYGFKEVAQYLLEESNNKKVILGTEGFFGTLPDGIQIYLDKSNVVVIGSTATISAQVRNAAKDNQTYFLGNRKRVELGIQNTRLIKEFPKIKPSDGNDQDANVLYQVFPNP